jgi:hypothetical protein
MAGPTPCTLLHPFCCGVHRLRPRVSPRSPGQLLLELQERGSEAGLQIGPAGYGEDKIAQEDMRGVYPPGQALYAIEVDQPGTAKIKAQV